MNPIDYLVKKLLTEERMRSLRLRERTEEDDNEDIPLIEFYCQDEYWNTVPKPKQSYKRMPEWFSAIPADLGHGAPRDQFANPTMTAKKCLPLVDGMSVGYSMVMFADLHVFTSKTGEFIDFHNPPTAFAGSTHSLMQLGGKTSPTYPGPALKFHNPWIVKTRPGWSTLFVPSLNENEKRFTCLSALVDTDTYTKQVNFPCIWHEKDYDGVVKAGTPLVTAIPIRRKDVTRDIIVRKITEAENQRLAEMERIQGLRSHYYTQELREPRK